MRIKERDEWKRVFIIYVESFEPMVMFFRMTNLLTIFQAIINEILRDIINERKVAIFMDNVLVEIEIKNFKLFYKRLPFIFASSYNLFKLLDILIIYPSFLFYCSQLLYFSFFLCCLSKLISYFTKQLFYCLYL